LDDRGLLDSRQPLTAEERVGIQEEFAQGFALLSKIEEPCVTVFGSARLPEDDPACVAAREVGREFAKRGWALITGGGPGAMEAANRGAQEAGGLSVGLGIELPHEQSINPYVDLGYTFKHFYARKVCFVKPAEGFVVMPGGVGTLDELFEVLVLIQTGKTVKYPVVLYDSSFWGGLVDWMRGQLLAHETISEQDFDLFFLCDDPVRAADFVVESYGSSS
jgi:hypothetical protein